MKGAEFSWVGWVGQRTMRTPSGLRRRGRFGRLVLRTLIHTPSGQRRAVRERSREQLWQAGVRQLPMIGGIGLALGLLVVGQAVALLRQVSAQQYMGMVMVTVVIREMGPLLTAFLLAARVGTATVVELGALRMAGRVEPVERLGVGVLREWVTPRVRALAVASVCLTVYLMAVALASGYLVAFLQGVPLRGGVYCRQLADALHWMDFALVTVKTALFGLVIGVGSCYHGLERLARTEDISQATTRAVVESWGGCVLVDALFLAGYFVR